MIDLATVESWANAHDGASLRAIAAHRAALLRAARRTPSQVELALALARLLDLEGASDEVERALIAASPHAADRRTACRLGIARTKLRFERGDLDAAVDEATRVAAQLDDAHDDLLLELRAQVHLILARLARLRGSEGEATAELALGRAAMAGFDSRGARHRPWLEAFACACEADERLAARRLTDARDALERGIRAAASFRGDLEVAVLCGLLGNLEHDAGNLESAVAAYGTASRRARAVGSAATDAIFVGYRAWALHELGHEARARRGYRDAIARAKKVGAARFEAQFRALAAVAHTSRRTQPQRALALAGALSELERLGDLQRARALEPLRAILEARAATGESAPRARTSRLIRAARWLDDARPDGDDGRIALRMARTELRRASETSVTGVAAHALRVTPDVEGFARDDRNTDLRRFPSHRAVLRSLLFAWVDGRVATDAELLEAGWPGEKASHDSATHRLRVAISSLRRDGLGEGLAREGEGYRLAFEHVEVVSVETLFGPTQAEQSERSAAP